MRPRVEKQKVPSWEGRQKDPEPLRASFGSNYEETDKLKLEDSLWKFVFTFQQCQYYERQRKAEEPFHIKGDQRDWHLNVMCDSGLHPGAGEVFSVKDTIGTIGEILVWLVY